MTKPQASKRKRKLRGYQNFFNYVKNLNRASKRSSNVIENEESKEFCPFCNSDDTSYIQDNNFQCNKCGYLWWQND